jgi:hypothetical protein
MKLLSSICLALAVACQTASYFGMYSLGGLGNAWRYFNFFTLDPILFMAVVALVVVCAVSLFLRSNTAGSLSRCACNSTCCLLRFT